MRQLAFDPLDWNTPEQAKKERDACYRALKEEGRQAKRWVLKNQLRKYSGFGQDDGRVRDVYYVTVYD